LSDDVAAVSSEEYAETLESLSQRMQHLRGVKGCELIQGSNTVKIRLQLSDGVFALLQRQQKEQGIDRQRYTATRTNLFFGLEKFARPALVARVEEAAKELVREYSTTIDSQQADGSLEKFLKRYVTKKTGTKKKNKGTGSKNKDKKKDNGSKGKGDTSNYEFASSLGDADSTLANKEMQEEEGVYPKMDNVDTSKALYLPLGAQLLSGFSQYALEQDISHLDITALCGIIRNCSYFDRYDRTEVDSKGESRTVNDLRRLSEEIKETRNYVSHRDVGKHQPTKGFDAMEELIELYGNDTSLLQACKR